MKEERYVSCQSCCFFAAYVHGPMYDENPNSGTCYANPPVPVCDAAGEVYMVRTVVQSHDLACRHHTPVPPDAVINNVIPTTGQIVEADMHQNKSNLLHGPWMQVDRPRSKLHNSEIIEYERVGKGRPDKEVTLVDLWEDAITPIFDLREMMNREKIARVRWCESLGCWLYWGEAGIEAEVTEDDMGKFCGAKATLDMNNTKMSERATSGYLYLLPEGWNPE